MIRVRDLAKELQISTAALRQHFSANGVKTKSHMSLIRDEDADAARSVFSGRSNGVPQQAPAAITSEDANGPVTRMSPGGPAGLTAEPSEDESRGNTEALRPCPFCGSDNVVVKDRGAETGENETRCYVECDTCGGRTGVFENRAWAIRCWNCRSTEAEMAKKIESMEQNVVCWNPYPQEKPTKSRLCAIAVEVDGNIILRYSIWHTTTKSWHKATNDLNIIAWHKIPKIPKNMRNHEEKPPEKLSYGTPSTEQEEKQQQL